MRAALDDVGRVERRRFSLLEAVVAPGKVGRLENDLRSRGVVVRGVRYAETATLTLAVDPGAGVPGLLAELTSGTASTRVVGEDWGDG